MSNIDTKRKQSRLKENDNLGLLIRGSLVQVQQREQKPRKSAAFLLLVIVKHVSAFEWLLHKLGANAVANFL